MEDASGMISFSVSLKMSNVYVGSIEYSAKFTIVPFIFLKILGMTLNGCFTVKMTDYT